MDGTHLVMDINPGGFSSDIGFWTVDAIQGNDTLLIFRANDGTHGWELWRTNGTTAGTELVADINPGSASGYPEYSVYQNGNLYFGAYEPVYGHEFRVLYDVAISMDELPSQNTFQLFPNPTSGILTISSNLQNENIDIYDLSGKIVLSVGVQSFPVHVSLETLETGMYIVRLNNSGVFKKVIVE